MKKLLRLPLIVNKKNKQVNFSIPKRALSTEDKIKLDKSKYARVFLEGFE